MTLWDDPGVHIFAQLGITFFGTSDGGAPSPLNPSGGAGWLDDGAPDTHRHQYHPWHFVASALRGAVSYGPTLTVELPTNAENIAWTPGERKLEITDILDEGKDMRVAVSEDAGISRERLLHDLIDEYLDVALGSGLR